MAWKEATWREISLLLREDMNVFRSEAEIYIGKCVSVLSTAGSHWPACFNSSFQSLSFLASMVQHRKSSRCLSFCDQNFVETQVYLWCWAACENHCRSNPRAVRQIKEEQVRFFSEKERPTFETWAQQSGANDKLWSTTNCDHCCLTWGEDTIAVIPLLFCPYLNSAIPHMLPSESVGYSSRVGSPRTYASVRTKIFFLFAV